MAEEKMQTCKKCDSNLPITDFSKAGKKKNGEINYGPSCKKCGREAYRAAHPLVDKPTPDSKECTMCGNELPMTGFDTCGIYKKTGKTRYRPACKPCSRLMTKNYKVNNLEHISVYNHEYKMEHTEEVKIYNREYNLNNREKIQARQTIQHAERLTYDPQYKMRCALSHRLGGIMKTLGREYKSASTLVLLDCSLAFFTDWIKSQFTGVMTFENYGKVWHIDHVIPCSGFDLLKAEQQQKCFHWTNLRPLLALENLSKNARLTLAELAAHETILNNYNRKTGTLPLVFNKLEYVTDI
ncbi:MAG: putative prophage protein [Harvfovirus sp.]|uniref:Putative prophage protein n=1 Tax=Harvfovirus sp. TaxID=2487768 RepID=A0A3G5A317_9VIRU|nr:MAG: putative prophage protein [Harvfovirus sp.]